MQDNIAIKVENLSKKYQIGEREKYITLRDKIMELPTQIFGGKKKKKEFWALKNVSFEIRKGEVVGVIGRNGAGKSTLLKILARITEPTEGKVTMKGRIASMLEVGTGFNPELTGRENIYLNGSILGMSHKEIKAKFDEILAFAGVGDFIDTPVKHYSSGMYVRLAFAVAAHLDADILLVDEVLAVGDIEFQKKCLGKMSDLASSGRTVIYVSHNMESVSKLCNQTILLDGGKFIFMGDTDVALKKFFQPGNCIVSITNGTLRPYIKIDRVITNTNKDSSIDIFIFGSAKKKLPKFRLTVSVYSGHTRVLSTHDVVRGIDLPKGNFKSQITLPANLIRPGRYFIYVGGYQEGTIEWFYIERIASFQIANHWSKYSQEADIGIINIPFAGHREIL